MSNVIDIPRTPQTSELVARYGITPETELAITQKRQAYAHNILNHAVTFVSVDGPCALTDSLEATEEEAQQKADNGTGLDGYEEADRQCFYKPRSDPDSWHGLGVSHPEMAYRLLSQLATRHANLAAEVGSVRQFQRHGSKLSLAWFGGRNVWNGLLMRQIALLDPSIVLGIKNGLDGEIDEALQRVKQIEQLRGDEGAPAILIYRGGENARNPRAWREMYKRVFDATDGRFLVDTAHGTEMAHDPDGKFGKTADGQVRATEAVVDLSEQGYAPAGKFSEASRLFSPVDPPMPLQVSLTASRQIYMTKRSGLTVPATS